MFENLKFVSHINCFTFFTLNLPTLSGKSSKKNGFSTRKKMDLVNSLFDELRYFIFFSKMFDWPGLIKKY